MNLDVLFNASAKPKGCAPDSITIRRPDDWHIHLRDGAMLQAVLPFTAGQFARGIVMPNLVPPVTTVAAAEAYRVAHSRRPPARQRFPADDDLLSHRRYIRRRDREQAMPQARGSRQSSIPRVRRQIPITASGTSRRSVPVLERMERIGMPVLIHGEATDPAIDIFDRESVFMQDTLLPLLGEHQGLKVVIEHVTTEETAAIVRAHAPRVAGTITPHHLMINRTSIFQGGLRPHLYCLPVAKREHHRIALRRAVTSGESCFFIGTDTAPHIARSRKQAAAAPGVFVGATALQTYTQVFDEEGALDRLEDFASLNGAKFYGLAPNAGTIEMHPAAGSGAGGGARRGRMKSWCSAATRTCRGRWARSGHDQRRDRLRDGTTAPQCGRRACQPRSSVCPCRRLGEPGLYRLSVVDRRTKVSA